MYTYYYIFPLWTKISINVMLPCFLLSVANLSISCHFNSSHCVGTKAEAISALLLVGFPHLFLFHRYFPPSQAVPHLSSTFVGYSEINFHLNCMRAGVAPTETILPFYEGVSWILIGATVWLSLPQTHTHLHSNRFLILAWMLNEQHSQAREKKQECKTST